MKIKLNNGGYVSTTNCTFYDVYIIIIDEEEKTIDVSDQFGMMIGLIHYENEKEITFAEYDSFGRLKPEIEDIIENGKIIWNKDK